MEDITLHDFTTEDIDLLTYVIETSMDKTNPIEWMEGYISGALEYPHPNDMLPNYILLLDIFWSYLWQGGGPHTSTGHIATNHTTSDVFESLVNHLIDTNRFDIDSLVEFINNNTIKTNIR